MFLFFSSVIGVYRELGIQRKYVAKNIVPLLAELEEQCDGTFPAYQREKILRYYTVANPVMLGLQFRKLYNQPFTEQDRWSSTMTALMTPVFDDMFDIEKYDLYALRELMRDPDHNSADTFSSRVLKKIQQVMMKTAPDYAAYMKECEAIFDVQVDTLKQLDPDTSRAELERVTYAKGFVSFMFYHVHMAGTPGTAETAVFYESAGLWQTCNDLFDIYKDLHEKTYTTANTCTDFTAFREVFMERIRIQNQKIMALPYDRRNKKGFALIIQAVEARGLVAFDQLINLEKKIGKGLAFHSIPRKELIVDMEKPNNFFKWLYYIWKISRI